ncbi:MAG: trypsin-like peptidase domain-containing protein [Firmicutes bacterium]|nr:trypsin-like peptidase domain-containing protein [Bacillota bacterium]
METNQMNEFELQTEQPVMIEPADSRKQKKTGKGAARLVALALCFSLLGGALGAGGAIVWANSRTANQPAAVQTAETERVTPSVNLAYTGNGEAMSLEDVYAMNVNSTVGIRTSITTNYFGYTTTAAAAGSGFILTADGYIVTNYHVVENSRSISVTTYDGTSYDATLVGYDEDNDVAVLKIDASGLQAVTLGDSDKLAVGQAVAAIGNPLGELTFSLTSGVVSALDREITMSNGSTMNLIQTDAAINSGNSGGALFNLYGEVVGITNAKYSSNSSSDASIDNIGFAIPINTVKSIVESIMEKGYVSKPFIGVTVTEISSDNQKLGLPQGLAVNAVTEDGPAAKAGVQANDIITGANGNAISRMSDLEAVLRKASVGDTITLSLYRQGKTLEVEVILGEKATSSQQQEAESQQTESENGRNGMNIFPGFPWFGGFGG